MKQLEVHASGPNILLHNYSMDHENNPDTEVQEKQMYLNLCIFFFSCALMDSGWIILMQTWVHGAIY